jgi:hypothetical protein
MTTKEEVERDVQAAETHEMKVSKVTRTRNQA